MEIIIGLTIIIAFIIGYASGKKHRPDAEKTTNSYMRIIADQRAEIQHLESRQPQTPQTPTITISEADPFPNVSLERVDELKTMPYRDEYLQTPEWKARAEIMRRRFKHRCQTCNSKAEDKPLEVHHRHYENRGHECPIDLTVLCRECHQLIENHRM